MRKFLIVVVIFVLALLGLLAVLPYAVPDWVEQQIVDRLQQARIPIRNVELRSLSLVSCDLAAIEIAKRFGTTESSGFVNGLLDSISKAPPSDS